MAGAVIAPAMPAISAEFANAPLADLLTRFVLTTPALFIALFAPIGGWLVDRIGRRPVLLASLLLYAASGASTLLIDSLTTLLLGRAALGIAVGALMTALTTLVGDCFDGHLRNQVLGRQAAAAGLGGSVFQVFGGLLAGVSWRAPFGLYLIALVLLPLALRAFREMETSGLRQPGPTDRDPAESSTAATTRDWSVRAVAGLCACMLAGMGLFYMAPLQVPYLLVAMGHPGAALAGLALSVNTLCAAWVSYRYPRIERLLTARQRLVLVFGTLALGLALIGLGWHLATVIVGLGLVGGAIGLLIPTVNQWLLRLAPGPIRGRIIGISTASLFMGQFLSPLLSQPWVPTLGLAGGFLAFAGIALGLAVLVLLLTRDHG